MKIKLNAIHLVLFLTRGMSLKQWDLNGSLQREIALYRELGKHLRKISIVSYGGVEESQYNSLFDGLQVLYNRWNLPTILYEKLIPYLHAQSLQQGDVFKTNQMDGALACSLAAKKMGKPFISRNGYLWSEFVESNPAKISLLQRAKKTENHIFNSANHIVVTTPRQADRIMRAYGIHSGKCTVIPNYVLTDVFTPAAAKKTVNKTLCMVGRLDTEKNPLAVLEACRGLDIELNLVGSGPLREQIIRRACEWTLRVQLLGTVPHEKLPDILQCSTMFALVSPLEGHPKSLLEAMSCGLPVIGANSPGIREEIQHGQNGLLCETDSASIRHAVQALLHDEELCTRLGVAARNYIEGHYSLDRVLSLELEVIQKVVGYNT